MFYLLFILRFEIFYDRIQVMHPKFLEKIRLILWEDPMALVFSESDIQDYKKQTPLKESHEALRLLSLITGWRMLIGKITLIERPNNSEHFLNKER